MASIEKRKKPGSWKIVICNGYDASGKKSRLIRTVHVDPNKTELAQRREVEKMAAALETDFDRHLITDANKIRLSTLAEEFLSERKMADRTRSFYRSMLEKRIIPELGKEYVQDLSPKQIRAFYKKLSTCEAFTARSRTGKLSGTSQLHHAHTLHALLTYAVHSGYITVNPADAVENPRKDTKETEFYELDDCGKLLKALDDLPDLQWRLFFYIAIYTGMRPGEIIALNWSDIIDHVLTVRAGSAYVKGKGTIRTDRPKTRKSVRSIDLPPVVMSLLNQHRKEQAEYRLKFGKAWPEPDAVFTGDEGFRLNISSPTQKWQKIVKKYNLRPITLYGLRHTAASIMIAQGLNAREVSARLGHAQTSTTLNIYTHAFADANSKATAAISSALEQARKEVL